MYYGQSCALNGNEAGHCMEINQEWHGNSMEMTVPLYEQYINFFLTPTINMQLSLSGIRLNIPHPCWSHEPGKQQ